MTTSSDGITWSPVRRVTSGTGDNTLPGIGADPLSASPSARIGITYYHYDPRCAPDSCLISVRFVSSADGGATWSRPGQVAGPMRSSWLARIGQGTALSSFITTTVLPGGHAVTAFPLASPPTGSTLHQDIYTVSGGLPIRGPLTPQTTGLQAEAAFR